MIKTNLRESYRHYRKRVEDPLDQKRYLALNAAYNRFLLEKVLDGHEVTLPSRMGTLCITGKKQKVRFDDEGNIKGLAPDWVATKALRGKSEKARKERKIVYHINNETGGYRYRFTWSKKNAIVANKTLYSLKMTRGNKREASKRIKEGTQYITR